MNEVFPLHAYKRIYHTGSKLCALAIKSHNEHTIKHRKTKKNRQKNYIRKHSQK